MTRKPVLTKTTKAHDAKRLREILRLVARHQRNCERRDEQISKLRQQQDASYEYLNRWEDLTDIVGGVPLRVVDTSSISDVTSARVSPLKANNRSATVTRSGRGARTFTLKLVDERHTSYPKATLLGWSYKDALDAALLYVAKGKVPKR